MAILVNNPFVADSRGWKIATSLGASGYRVTVVARGAPGLLAEEHHATHRVLRIDEPAWAARLRAPRLPLGNPDARPLTLNVATVRALASRAVMATVGRSLQAARYLVVSRARARMVARRVGTADIWQAEDIITLSLARSLSRRSGGLLVYDANDIDSEAGRFASLPGAWRALLRHHERSIARAAHLVITVSPGYARILGRILDRPVDAVVLNGPLPFQPPDPPERRFHHKLGLAPDVRVVLYLGQVMGGRGLEQLFDALSSIDRAVLVVVGFGPDLSRYRGMASAHREAGRIHLMEAVPPDEVLPWTASADLAVMPVQPDTLNHRHNTPTKLYDAMAAGVPVVASNLPGMARIIRETGCGELCDPRDPRDIARAANAILEAPPSRRAEYGASGRRAAGSRYGWAAQARILMDAYAAHGFAPPVDDAQLQPLG